MQILYSIIGYLFFGGLLLTLILHIWDGIRIAFDR